MHPQPRPASTALPPAMSALYAGACFACCPDCNQKLCLLPQPEYDDVAGRKEVLRKLLGSFDEGGAGCGSGGRPAARCIWRLEHGGTDAARSQCNARCGWASVHEPQGCGPLPSHYLPTVPQSTRPSLSRRSSVILDVSAGASCWVALPRVRAAAGRVCTALMRLRPAALWPRCCTCVAVQPNRLLPHFPGCRQHPPWERVLLVSKGRGVGRLA